MKAIIHLTDNSLDENIAKLCRKYLIKEACISGTPIISVSHKPIDLGKNICIGEKKRCWLTLYEQLIAGLEATDAMYIAMAEHDCLYTHTFFNWIPPEDNIFYESV